MGNPDATNKNPARVSPDRELKNMAYLTTKFASNSQEWSTPDSLFLPLHAEFNFTLDVCASKSNAKCAEFFTKEIDGLSQFWDGVCWMNPPFNALGKWVLKAWTESQRNAIVVCLLPSRTNTNWWHDYAMKGEVRFIRGRPKFGGWEHGLPQPLATVIFRK